MLDMEASGAQLFIGKCVIGHPVKYSSDSVLCTSRKIPIDPSLWLLYPCIKLSIVLSCKALYIIHSLDDALCSTLIFHQHDN